MKKAWYENENYGLCEYCGNEDTAQCNYCEHNSQMVDHWIPKKKKEKKNDTKKNHKTH